MRKIAGKKARRLSKEERALWLGVTRAVAPSTTPITISWIISTNSGVIDCMST